MNHQEKMARRKAVQDAEVASKTVERGLVLVHTGRGKGKSTAAFGLALRMAGHGRRVAVVQFIKGAWRTGERDLLEGGASPAAALIAWHSLGEGFSWETQDAERDRAAAARAWSVSAVHLADPAVALVVLDEIVVAIRLGQVAEADVLAALAARPAAQHVVLTGRNASAALLEAADCVTEMMPVKHHFAAGVRAQAGIEF